MSFRRAIWVEDQSVLSCTKCRTEFNYTVPKHHCRKCGLIFCHECTRNKCIVPQDELVPRPPNWMSAVTVANEDNFRMPQRVCDACCYQLRDIQEELRQAVSRYRTRLIDKFVNLSLTGWFKLMYFTGRTKIQSCQRTPLYPTCPVSISTLKRRSRRPQ